MSSVDVQNNFQRQLWGKDAFFENPDYLETTEAEFKEDHPLQSSYECNIGHKTTRFANRILPYIFFPIAFKRFLHSLAGYIVLLPAARYSKKDLSIERVETDLNDEWKYKRLSIKCNGNLIDAVILVKKSTASNGRWTIGSFGNGENYESYLSYYRRDYFKEMLSEVESNAILFNFPGVGASAGFPNRDAAIRAYRAVLTFLEDQKEGIGAREIIGFGHSIGAGIQAEAVKRHESKKEIQYVWVKSRTFGSTAHLAKEISGKAGSLSLRILGWNIDTLDASKNLKDPEIIIQSTRFEEDDYQIFDSAENIMDDGIIGAKSSLAASLLAGGHTKNKTFIGVPDGHNDALSDPEFIADRIREDLDRL
ncbi:hypothetical protein PHSC3_001800 [Chlamydiales bacterium STE3]|nr:hypothetical protein PHSC3_001800 [Chlamydiales bacterium STE3]